MPTAATRATLDPERHGGDRPALFSASTAATRATPDPSSHASTRPMLRSTPLRPTYPQARLLFFFPFFYFEDP